DQVRPRAVMIENVRGLLDPVFAEYRELIKNELRRLGYECDWKLMNASDFGVPQLRPRAVLVAVERQYSDRFTWPDVSLLVPLTVGEVLHDLMSAKGWKGAIAWRDRANDIAPTIVGGSLKHGGPDLGPTRAKQAWAALGVDGMGIVEEAPGPEF